MAVGGWWSPGALRAGLNKNDKKNWGFLRSALPLITRDLADAGGMSAPNGRAERSCRMTAFTAGRSSRPPSAALQPVSVPARHPLPTDGTLPHSMAHTLFKRARLGPERRALHVATRPVIGTELAQAARRVLLPSGPRDALSALATRATRGTHALRRTIPLPQYKGGVGGMISLGKFSAPVPIPKRTLPQSALPKPPDFAGGKLRHVP